MIVRELIKKLQSIENQDAEVYGHADPDCCTEEPLDICDDIDDSMSGPEPDDWNRVDLNLKPRD